MYIRTGTGSSTSSFGKISYRLNSDLSAEVTRAKGVEVTKLSLIHTTSPTVAQLKTADIVIVRLGRSGLTGAGSAVLFPNVPIVCNNIIYDGSTQQLGGVTCQWSRTNGTVVLTGGNRNILLESDK